MPRVPTLDGPRVASRGLSTQNPQLDTRSGLRDVAEGVGQLAGVMARREHEARQRANATAANDGLTQLQRDTITTLDGDVENKTPGALSLRGKEAVGGSTGALEHLEKRREEIATGLANDEQRQIFRKHSDDVLLGARSRVEKHVSSERQAAEVESLNGRKAVELQAIASNYADEAGAGERTRSVESTLRAFARTEEGAEASAQAWRGDVAKVRLEKYLGADDWKSAETLFEKSKDVLGPDAAKYEAAIGAVKRGALAEEMARTAVEESRGANGRVDADKALDSLDEKSGGDVKLLDEARKRAKERGLQEEEAWGKETEGISKAAYAAYNTGGWRGIPAVLKEKLNERNPALYHQLQAETERKWRQRKEDGAAVRREQAEIDRAALLDFMTYPAAERATLDVKAFLAERPGVSPNGGRVLSVEQRKAKDVDGASEGEFMGEAMAGATGVITSKTELARYKAEAAIAYQRLAEKLKRVPTRAEATDEIANLHLREFSKPGFLYGKNEEPEWQRRERERKGVLKRPAEQRPEPEPLQNSANRAPADESALKWARENPADPRAAAIFKRLGEAP